MSPAYPTTGGVSPLLRVVLSHIEVPPRHQMGQRAWHGVCGVMLPLADHTSDPSLANCVAAVSLGDMGADLPPRPQERLISAWKRQPAVLFLSTSVGGASCAII